MNASQILYPNLSPKNDSFLVNKQDANGPHFSEEDSIVVSKESDEESDEINKRNIGFSINMLKSSKNFSKLQSSIPSNKNFDNEEQRLLNLTKVFNELFNQELEEKEEEVNLIQEKEEYENLYKEKNPSYFLFLQENYSLDSILFKFRRRKKRSLNHYQRYFIFCKEILSLLAYRIIHSSAYQILNGCLILLNFAVYINSILENKSISEFYLIITPFYLIELIMRIFAKKSKFWILNSEEILDLIIIIGCLLNIFGINPVASFFEMPLRIYRIPQLLKLKNISNILEGILSSMKVLGETMWFLLIFCSFYALAGQQLFSGVLKYQCIHKESGILLENSKVCGNYQCPAEYFCGKLLNNPQKSPNFDNFLSCIIEVLRVITFDNWTDLMNMIQRGLTNYSSIYFVSLALVGNFFLFNFFLAVLKVRFDTFQYKLEKNTNSFDNLLVYDIKKLKEKGIYSRKNTIMLNQRNVSLTSNEFEKSVMAFLKKKIYNFEDNTKIWDDLELKKNFRNRLFIVEVKNSEKYKSDSKNDVLLDIKTKKISFELANLKRNLKKTHFKNSLLSNTNIFSENFRQIEKKVFDYPVKFPQKNKIEFNYNYLIKQHEKLEKMMPKSINNKVSPSIFALNKRSTAFTKTANPFLNIIASNNINESFSINASSQTSFCPFPIQKVESFNVNAENRNRSKSSPVQKNIGQSRFSSKTQKNSKKSNNSLYIENPLAIYPRASIKEDHTCIFANQNRNNNNLNIVNQVKRRNSFLLSFDQNYLKTNKSLNENIMRSNSYFSQSSRKQTQINLAIFPKPEKKKLDLSRIKIEEKKIKTLHNPNLNAETPQKFSEYMDMMKKKNFGYQKELEKKYGISLKHGINYEQAQMIMNDNKDNEIISKYKLFDNEKIFLQILRYDAKSHKFFGNIWSGTDLEIVLSHEKLKKVLYALSFYDLDIWHKGFNGKVNEVRRLIRYALKSKYFNFFMNTLILSYMIHLCLEGFIEDYTWDKMNLFFLLSFSIESICKLFGFGIKNYLRDTLNFIDFLCQILFIADLFSLYVFGTLNQNEFSILSIFRGIYPLKILRLMLYSEYIRAIVTIIKATFKSFLSISILLTFLILLYALYGIKLFSQYYAPNYETQVTNFHNLTSSIGTVFLIINFVWYECLTELNEKKANFYQLSFYNISLIFLGHLIFLNLFIAIMLRGFGQSEEEEEMPSNEKKTQQKTEPELSEHNSFEQIRNSYVKKKTAKINMKESDSLSIKGSSNSSESDPPIITESKFLGLAFFGKNSKLKISRSIQLLKSKIYKQATKFMIILTMISMAAETYDEGGVIHTFKYIINFYFLADLMLNVIILGSLTNKLTYINRFFQLLEILIITGSFIEIFAGGQNYIIIQILGMLRLARPLRMINEMKGMKQVLNSIIFSLGGLLKVFLMVLMVWLMFAISGMKLFRNKFGYCGSPDTFFVNQEQCLEKNKWIIYPFNFDNALSSLLVLFIIGTFDDEVQNILSIAINADYETKGPIPYNNQAIVFIFFWIFIIVGVWFFLNLFIGVVFMNFKITQKSIKNPNLTENQIQWIKMEKVIARVNPLTKNLSGRNMIKKFSINLLKSNFHRLIIVLASGVLFIVLSLDNEPPIIKNYDLYLNYLTFALTAIYIYEILLKFIAYGFSGYFEERWHSIQLMITIIYFFSSLLIIVDESYSISIEKKYLRLFSFFKLFGMFRVLERLTGIKKLFITLKFNSANIKNILYLFILTLTIYSVIGCYLFKNIKTGKIIDDYVNFKNFLYAMMTLIRCFTANSWPNIMKDTNKIPPNCTEDLDCGSRFSPFFFISCLFIFQIILCNILVLVLLEQFEYFSKNPKNPVLIFHQNLGSFRKAWAEYTLQKPMKIKNLFEFLRLLGPPLGVKKNDDYSILGNKIKKLLIFVDKKENIDFHVLLHSLMKNYILDELYRESDKNDEENKKKAKKELIKKEKKFYNTLTKMKGKNLKTNCESSTNAKENNQIKYHPIKTLFYCHLVFNLWLKFSQSRESTSATKFEEKKKVSSLVFSLNSSIKTNNFVSSPLKNHFLFKNSKLNNFEHRMQSVILEQEEENEENKKSIEKIEQSIRKRRVTSKVTPKSFVKKSTC